MSNSAGRISRFEVERVHFMPKGLISGILYVSQEFGTAAHLCACGCGSKVRTPLGQTEWSVEETKRGPTLYPSVGNWQKSCRSHYFITCGDVIWADKWTPEQIAAGRYGEEERRSAYYSSLDRRRGLLDRFWNWIKGIFAR